MTAKEQILEIDYPEKRLSGEELDDYLLRGWFRSSNTMCRSMLICKDDRVLSVKNIRLSISEYQAKKRLRKIIRKNEERFRTVVRPLFIDDEKERLYQQHCSRYTGYVFESLSLYLYAQSSDMIFDSYEVSIYDQDRLIAFSVFDMGTDSIASIIGIYDNHYSKFSLGIYTMLCEVAHAQKLGKSYYYPGYVFHLPSEFDYKLRLGDYEYLDSDHQWVPLEQSKEDDWLADRLVDLTKSLESALMNEELDYRFYFYSIFTFGYIDIFTQLGFIKEPIILELFDEQLPRLMPYKVGDSSQFFVAYRPDDDLFCLFVTEPFLLLNDFPQMDFGENQLFHLTQPTCYSEILYQTHDLDDLIIELNSYR